MKSFTKFYVLMLALFVSAGIFAQSSSMTSAEYQYYKQLIQQKDALLTVSEYNPSDYPPPSRQGGEDVGTAVVIGGFPFTDNGTTSGYTDDYDEACPFTGSTSPDVVYSYTPTEPLLVTLDLCDSDYDTKLYVYENTVGNNIACNDDGCPGFRSILYDVPMNPGNTYYIIVDGYGGANGDYILHADGVPPPPPNDPIVAFPFSEDFESCTWPITMLPYDNSQSNAEVTADAAYMSSCGVMLEGNSSSGYPFTSGQPCDYYFTNAPDHVAGVLMTVEPDGTNGLLQLEFDHQQFYSFQDWYSWLRVTVTTPGGTFVVDEKSSQETCMQTGEPNGAGWSKVMYDLSPFQNEASIDVSIEYVGKYYYQYYQGGDAVMIDNVYLWYVPAGDIEGYGYNVGVPESDIEVGFLGDNPPYAPVFTDALGYYRFSLVPAFPEDTYPMYAFKDGINYMEGEVTVIADDVVQLDWFLEPPLMVITPAVLEETMNPNEWRAVPISITNGPGGPLTWTAEIIFGAPPPFKSGSMQVEEVPVIDNRTFLSQGEKPIRPPMSFDNRGNDDTRDGLDVAIVTSALPASNDFSEIRDALLALGINSVTEIAMDPTLPLVDDLLAYDGLLFGLNTFFTIPTDPVGDLMADYVDEGGKLIISSPINATGFPGLPIGGRFLSEGYYPVTFGGPDFSTRSLGTFNPDHPIMEGVSGGTAGLTVVCNAAADAELVASWNSGTAAVAVKGSVIGINVFFAADGWWTSDVDLMVYNAFNFLHQSGGGGWLNLSALTGVVPAGESDFVNAIFDATGTLPGQVWTADINFTAQPNVSTAVVDVSMIIAGEPLVPVEDMEAEITNMATGQVDLSWTFPGNEITFEYFLIRRDGAPIANTQNMSYTDLLPDFGEFCYTVSAVYTEGESVPAGPECVIWLIPELCYTPDPVYGEVWTGFEETFELTLENCGEGLLEFEFTGFDDPEFSNSFVTSVSPYMGVIPEGETLNVNVTFDATGYGTGTHLTDLELMTNEIAPDNERMIACEMFVYTPAIFNGTVTDCDNGLPIANVTVRASSIFGDFFGETNATGYYEIYVDAASDPFGAYFLEVTKLSYETQFVWGLNISEGETQTNDVEMCETPYPVYSVVLDPNEADTQAKITWSLPMGPYEIIYDDGTEENYFAWIQYGGATAVKFTPAGYPASVIGGRIFVGDGSYPEGADFIGQPMAVGIADNDGPNGMPGTILDSAQITCTNYGWQEFGLNGTTFEEGDFYLVYWQISIPPFSPPVGIDEQNPVVFRSYTKQNGMDWQASAYNDFMMRATIFGPGNNVLAANAIGESVIPPKPTDGAHIAMKTPTGISGTVKGGTFMPVADQSSDRDLEQYRVFFVDDFDPDMGEMPWDGSTTSVAVTTENTYNHTGWGAQPPGFYAYAVRAEYESSHSDLAYSNVAAHGLDREVTVNVVQCDDEEPSGALVTLAGHNYPYHFLSGVTPASGTLVFDSVIMGIYDLAVNKLGYQSWEWPDMVVSDDMVVDVTLQETEYMPRNLYVDPLTSVATWDEPLYIQLPMQGFEELPFPPANWQIITPGIGWERVEDGSSSFWTIPSPPEVSGDWYAVANDDQFSGNTQDDYLITPEMDLREASDYELNSIWYYDGAWGQPQPEIVYSTDAGATWETLYTLTTGFDWQDVDLDLSELSGPDGLSSVWFAMYVYDAGWNSGAAVDNIYVGNGPAEIVGYHVYLDDGFVAETDADTRTYQYNNLRYGTTYTAAVAALYACNVSDFIYYTFTSNYLYPPRNLDNEYIYNTNEVPLTFNPPMTVAGPGAPPMVTLREQREVEPAPPADGRTSLSDGEEALHALNFDLRGSEGDRDDLDIAIISSALPGSNDFSEITAALLALGINSVTEVDLETSLPSVDDLLAYDACLFGFNTFFTSPTAPIGDMLADYIDGGGKLVMTVPVFITGFTGTPIEGRLLDDGYYPVIPGPGPVGPANLGTFNPDHPIMEGVTDADGNLLADCDLAPDAELVAEWDAGYPLVAHKESVVAVNCFIGAAGYMGGDLDLIIYNSLHFLQSGPIVGGEIPDGLASFNVYRDEMFVGTKNYNDEGVEDFIQFVDNPVEPGCYEYTVTAVYDLTLYGFPGETAESYPEGPDTVCVVWGYDLPFMEDWTEGNFDFNSWRTQAGVNNWMVHSQNGNPEPSAQFNWDPDPGVDYSITLESAPLKADLLTEGDIWLDFEYFLEDRNSTGTESLAVEVYNGQEWMQVAEYSNTSSFDWTFQHLQITNYAMGRVFQVRFNAMGANSFDVIRWNVDNIHVYRTCESPKDLDGEYLWNEEDDFGANIWWEGPDLPPPPEGWLFYHDGTIEYVWGSNSGDWESEVAMYFEPGQLTNYPNCAVTDMKLFVDSRGANGGYVIANVWEGPDAATLLYEEDVTDQIIWNDDINEVMLSQAVPFDNTQELWLGFTTGGPIDVYIAGITEEQAEPERRGDLYREDGGGWQHLSDLGIGERVWIFEAYVTQDYTPSSASVPLVYHRDNSGYGSVNAANGGATISINETSSREFTGFNIYRMGPGEMEYSLIDNVPYETGQTEFGYYDADPYTEEYPYDVCYQVTAVWESETDYCESSPAPSVVPIWDYVCISITSINDPLTDGMTALYPNPAQDRVNISSSQQIERITVFNYVGQVVIDTELNGEQAHVLNTSSYDAGVYVVKISTDNGVVTKRMTITR